MKLSSITDKKLIIPSLKSTTSRQAIAEIMEHVGRHVENIDRAALLNALYQREEVKTTAIGDEVAVPHARVDGNVFIFAMGVSRKGIEDFGAPDGRPVKLVFVIIAPKPKNSLMVHTLAGIARLCIDEPRRRALIDAKDADEILDIIEKSGVVIKKELTCSDIMDVNVVGVNQDMNLKEVAALFVKSGATGLPVIGEKGELLGEITVHDLVSVGLPSYVNMFADLSFLPSLEPFEEFFKREETMKVREVYQKHVLTISEKASLIEAAFLMVTRNRQRLYVTSEGKLVGTVNCMDFISKVLHV